MNRVCVNCRYWCFLEEASDDFDQIDSYGECRRYAPRNYSGGTEHDYQIGRAQFPWTYGGDWCGEFNNKDPRLPD